MSSTNLSAKKRLTINIEYKQKKSHIKEIIDVVNYFNYFNYAPSLGEIYRYFPAKITQKQLDLELKKLVAQGKVLRFNLKSLNSQSAYTLPGHSISEKRQALHSIEAKRKIKSLDQYFQLLIRIPAISFVGISGGVAMMDAEKKDDIDICIISGPNRIWTARFAAIIIAILFRRHRSRRASNVNDTVCLNLFFDGRELSIPAQKRNLYVAHEVLQMKPIFSRQNVYSRFIKANKWVFEIFPNGTQRVKVKNISEKPTNKSKQNNPALRLIGDLVESILKNLQLIFINRHRTTELVTDTQLWFFPQDMEKKLKKAKII